MENKLHIKTNKKTMLVDLLSKSQDRRRFHHLYLTSCYFTPESAKELIGMIGEQFKCLAGVTVFIDRKTATLHGKKVLSRFCKSTDYSVELFAVNSFNLFHSKAYAVISLDESDEIYCGSLVVGSANLTGAGLADKGGNIECLLDTQNVDMLEEFVSQINSLSSISVEDIDTFKISENDTLAFKYALLQRGLFIHKWTDDLGQYFAVKYKLNAKGKEAIGDPVFKDRGFNVETATISKRYFQFEYVPQHLEDADNLRKNYGIESYLGHWVPKSALASLLKNEDFPKFTKLLFDAMDEQYDSIMRQIKSDSEYLLTNGIIDEGESSAIELFDGKIKELRKNESKLMRIFSKFEVFDLPYDPKEKQEIEYLFESLVDLSESRVKKNAAMKGFLMAYQNANLDMLDENL